jgi:adenine-specific DNA-methyltransferase
MQLNAEDRANGKEGNRKYILVQLPEPIDPKKNKTAYDFVKNELGIAEPTIFEITKERLIRAGKKIQSEQKADLFTGENKLDFGFKIFETQPIWEDYEFEAKEFDAHQNFLMKVNYLVMIYKHFLRLGKPMTIFRLRKV